MLFERGGDLPVAAVKGGTAGRAGAFGTRRVQWFPLILVIYIIVQINCVLTNISLRTGDKSTQLPNSSCWNVNPSCKHTSPTDVLPHFLKIFLPFIKGCNYEYFGVVTFTLVYFIHVCWCWYHGSSFNIYWLLNFFGVLCLSMVTYLNLNRLFVA